MPAEYSIKLTRFEPLRWHGACIRFKGIRPVAIQNFEGTTPSEVLKKIETWIAAPLDVVKGD